MGPQALQPGDRRVIQSVCALSMGCSFTFPQLHTKLVVYYTFFHHISVDSPPLTMDDETQARMSQNSHLGSHQSTVYFQ